MALGLARAGFTVLGAVRREADAARLARLREPTLVPVGPLDLSRREQIPPAVRRVREDLGRLGVPLCAVGSARAGGMLKKAGFETVYNQAGGIIAWERGNLPRHPEIRSP